MWSVTSQLLVLFSFLSLFRSKQKSRSHGVGGHSLWTSREKPGVAVTHIAMDPWCLTPASLTWPHGALWPCTSPPAWGPSLSTATGTSRDTWRTAQSLRTPSRPRDRSSIHKRKNLRRTSRRKKTYRWWRRKEKQSCDFTNLNKDNDKCWRISESFVSQDFLTIWVVGPSQMYSWT